MRLRTQAAFVAALLGFGFGLACGKERLKSNATAPRTPTTVATRSLDLSGLRSRGGPVLD